MPREKSSVHIAENGVEDAAAWTVLLLLSANHMTPEVSPCLIRVLTWTSLAMSVVSFLVFVVLSFRIKRGSNGTAPEADLVRRGVEITDLTKLAEAGARLADSFTKAGPALSALVASILYLLIGTLGAGLDRLSQR